MSLKKTLRLSEKRSLSLKQWEYSYSFVRKTHNQKFKITVGFAPDRTNPVCDLSHLHFSCFVEFYCFYYILNFLKKLLGDVVWACTHYYGYKEKGDYNVRM